jgi:hypothetical protein
MTPNMEVVGARLPFRLGARADLLTFTPGKNLRGFCVKKSRSAQERGIAMGNLLWLSSYVGHRLAGKSFLGQ